MAQISNSSNNSAAPPALNVALNVTLKVALKVVWKVPPAATGRYRSFEVRSWPSAHYKDESESACASISCVDEYTPARTKSGEHAPLALLVAKHEDSGHWERKRLVKRFSTLQEAKAGLIDFLGQHPEFMPVGLRPACASESPKNDAPSTQKAPKSRSPR